MAGTLPGFDRVCRPGASRHGRSLRLQAHAGKASTIQELQADLRAKRRSAVEITTKYIEQIHQTNDKIKSFITVDAEKALQQARAIDEHIAKHGTEKLPPLAGVPVAVKDNLCTRGTRTTAGSRVLGNFVPSYDATSVSRLRDAGAVLVGKTNMDEFGMGSTTENSAYAATRNPWAADHVPGGSSGGSAAAVAAGHCAAALGSDTGGSIRQPASFCGVVGLKPTYGRVSRYGLIAYASSLDVVGPMATSVRDAAALLGVIAGGDPADATCAVSPAHAVEPFKLLPAEQLASKPLEGKRLGVIKETQGEGLAPEVAAAFKVAVAHLQSLGAQVTEVSLPAFHAGLPTYYVLALSEASSNLSRYDGIRYGVKADGAAGLTELYQASRGGGLGPEVKRRILMGTYALSAGYYDAYYKRALQVRSLLQQELAAALGQLDGLLCPAAPTAAYKLGEKLSDPLAMYKGDLMTVNVNLAGVPALVVPCGLTPGGLPVGLQIVGQQWGEQAILEIGHAFETTLGLDLSAPGRKTSDAAGSSSSAAAPAAAAAAAGAAAAAK